jgi:hypothetical protein
LTRLFLRRGRSGLTAIENLGADLAGGDFTQGNHGRLVLIVTIEIDQRGGAIDVS